MKFMFPLVALLFLTGCTVMYDGAGNPHAVIGNPLAGTPSEREQLAKNIEDTASTVAPFLPPPFGQILLGVGALAGGVVAERRVRKVGDEMFDEGVKRANEVKPLNT